MSIWGTILNHYIRCKVRVIQKSTKIFFVGFFTWFVRARRALQTCPCGKNLNPLFESKCKRYSQFIYEEKH